MVVHRDSVRVRRVFSSAIAQGRMLAITVELQPVDAPKPSLRHAAEHCVERAPFRIRPTRADHEAVPRDDRLSFRLRALGSRVRIQRVDDDLASTSSGARLPPYVSEAERFDRGERFRQIELNVRYGV